MKSAKSPTRITSVFALIFSFVAMMCMFADAFAGESGCARGNVYSVMFALQDGYNVVVPLIIGFALSLSPRSVAFSSVRPLASPSPLLRSS